MRKSQQLNESNHIQQQLEQQLQQHQHHMERQTSLASQREDFEEDHDPRSGLVGLPPPPPPTASATPPLSRQSPLLNRQELFSQRQQPQSFMSKATTDDHRPSWDIMDEQANPDDLWGQPIAMVQSPRVTPKQSKGSRKSAPTARRSGGTTATALSPIPPPSPPRSPKHPAMPSSPMRPSDKDRTQQQQQQPQQADFHASMPELPSQRQDGPHFDAWNPMSMSQTNLPAWNLAGEKDDDNDGFGPVDFGNATKPKNKNKKKQNNDKKRHDEGSDSNTKGTDPDDPTATSSAHEEIEQLRQQKLELQGKIAREKQKQKQQRELQEQIAKQRRQTQLQQEREREEEAQQQQKEKEEEKEKEKETERLQQQPQTDPFLGQISDAEKRQIEETRMKWSRIQSQTSLISSVFEPRVVENEGSVVSQQPEQQRRASVELPGVRSDSQDEYDKVDYGTDGGRNEHHPNGRNHPSPEKRKSEQTAAEDASSAPSFRHDSSRAIMAPKEFTPVSDDEEDDSHDRVRGSNAGKPDTADNDGGNSDDENAEGEDGDSFDVNPTQNGISVSSSILNPQQAHRVAKRSTSTTGSRSDSLSHSTRSNLSRSNRSQQTWQSNRTLVAGIPIGIRRPPPRIQLNGQQTIEDSTTIVTEGPPLELVGVAENDREAALERLTKLAEENGETLQSYLLKSGQDEDIAMATAAAFETFMKQRQALEEKAKDQDENGILSAPYKDAQLVAYQEEPNEDGNWSSGDEVTEYETDEDEFTLKDADIVLDTWDDDDMDVSTLGDPNRFRRTKNLHGPHPPPLPHRPQHGPPPSHHPQHGPHPHHPRAGTPHHYPPAGQYGPGGAHSIQMHPHHPHHPGYYESAETTPRISGRRRIESKDTFMPNGLPSAPFADGSYHGSGRPDQRDFMGPPTPSMPPGYGGPSPVRTPRRTYEDESYYGPTDRAVPTSPYPYQFTPGGSYPTPHPHNDGRYGPQHNRAQFGGASTPLTGHGMHQRQMVQHQQDSAETMDYPPGPGQHMPGAAMGAMHSHNGMEGPGEGGTPMMPFRPPQSLSAGGPPSAAASQGPFALSTDSLPVPIPTNGDTTDGDGLVGGESMTGSGSVMEDEGPVEPPMNGITVPPPEAATVVSALDARTLNQQLNTLSIDERKVVTALQTKWESKTNRTPFPPDWYLRFAQCSPGTPFTMSSAWKVMKKFDRRYLTLSITTMEHQLMTQTLFPVRGLKSIEGHNSEWDWLVQEDQ